MRLALAAALLSVSLCGQGCLCYFFYRSSPTDRAARLKRVSITTGTLSGVLMIAGISMMAAGAHVNNTTPGQEGVSLGFSAGFGWILGGTLLFSGSLPLGLISLIWGARHAREANRYGDRKKYPDHGSGRRIWPTPYVPGEKPTVGLLRLDKINPGKLPIQRTRWYWTEED